MFNNIVIKAGKAALNIIKDEGLSEDRIKVIAGAAGGPKWLVLTGLDRYIFNNWFKNRKDSLYLLGVSIGAWRFAALAQKKPLKALKNFEEAYLEQTYSKKPGYAEVMKETIKGLDGFFDDKAAHQILNHKFFRLNIITNRSRYSNATDNKLLLGANLLIAATLNILSPKGMHLFFERNIFSDKRDKANFVKHKSYRAKYSILNKKNIRDVIMASGAIPFFMPGIKNIHGIKPGIHRDGGMLDYHLDVPFLDKGDKEGLVLYPHFNERIIPGWFDKILKKRKPEAENMDNVVLVSPSADFIKNLPYSKIPDRTDFKTFQGNDKERNKYWREVLLKNRILADEFREAVESKKISDIVKPLETK